ncbi:MAG: hypothetical protein HYZ44_17660 [Bacteroidetes bacterium]|nr:hypothetical protein [Bacteroidota bacterium]
MKKLLTSQLTVFYKIVFPTIWTLIFVGLMIFIFIDSNDPRTFFMVIMILPMLLVIKIQQVSYDDKNVYIYNWRTTQTYELKDIKSINEGNILTFDPFFEIEILAKNGTIKKVDFMPRVFEQLTYMFTKKYTGQLLDFKTKVATSKES